MLNKNKIFKWISYLVALVMLDVLLSVLWLAFQQETSFLEAFIEIGQFVGVMIFIAKIIIEVPIEALIFISADIKFNRYLKVHFISGFRVLLGFCYSFFTGMAAIGGSRGSHIDTLVLIVIVASAISPLILSHWLPNKSSN